MKAAVNSRNEIVQRIQALPPMPHTLMRVWQVIDDPDSDNRTLATAVSADPALVASLLKLANSASYGRARTITTVSEAITLMGYNVIKRICMALVAKVGLLAPEKEGRRFDRMPFWRHCVGTALAAESLGEMLRLPNCEIAFSHGLLHDIGVLAMDRCLPDELDEVLVTRDRNDGNFMELEQVFVGMRHTDLGAALADHWKLPNSLRDVIQFHPRPRREKGREMEVLIHVACTLTDRQEYCMCCTDPKHEFDQSRQFLNLSGVQLNRARDHVMSRIVEIAQAFEV